MRILAIDAATTLGWALGEAGVPPESGSITLAKKGAAPEKAVAELAARLFNLLGTEETRPDVIVIERYMSPGVSRSGKSTISQLLLHGTVHAIAKIFNIPVRSPTVGQIRINLCGKATAITRKRGEPPRTTKERELARKANKQMVIDKLYEIGYLPEGVRDNDRADAVAVFVWGERHLAPPSGAEVTYDG